MSVVPEAREASTVPEAREASTVPEAREASTVPDGDAVRALLDRLAADLGLEMITRRNGRPALALPDGTRVETWRENYPYADRLGRSDYEPAMRGLQIELLKLQRWVKATGARVLLLFEGRDAAGKGGAIRRFTENLNPRGVRVVALDKPAAHEQGDNYLRRYLPHLPGAGEIALFDRSWYNRAGVEQVMGFCQPEEYARFLCDAPAFERGLVADGITVIKLWFSITRAEQLRRFADRHADPMKRFKLSPVDLASLDRWAEYTAAKDAMFARTDIAEAPWTVVRGNDKKRGRLEAVRYVVSLFDYPDKQSDVVGQPDPLIVGPVGGLSACAEDLPGTRRPANGTHVPAASQVPLSSIAPAARARAAARAESAVPAGLAVPAGRT